MGSVWSLRAVVREADAWGGRKKEVVEWGLNPLLSPWAGGGLGKSG
jgi:hypothetical protein